MRAAQALVRLIWGDDLDLELRPVVGVTFAASVAGSGLWTFMAIWAVEELGGSPACRSCTSSGRSRGGYRVPRRVAVRPDRAPPGDPGRRGADDRLPARAARALEHDVSGPGGAHVRRRLRLARRLGRAGDGRRPRPTRTARRGVRVGPGRSELRCGDRASARWPRAAPRRLERAVPAVAILSAIAWLIALRSPHRGEYAPEGPPDRGSFATIHADRAFLMFLGSAVFAWIVYVAYEVVLPVSLVDGFGYETAAWGFIVWINPLLVTLLQVRLTRATAGFPSALKLVVAMLMMGLPFLLLIWSHSVLAVVTVCRRVRRRRDAVGADLAGDRGGARARGSARRVHGRVR